MKAFVQKHIVLLFVVLTYAATWSVQLPAALLARGLGGWRVSLGALTLSNLSPSAVALVLVGFGYGRPGVRLLARRFARPWMGFRWYAFAILAPMVLTGGVLGFYILTGQVGLPRLHPIYEIVAGILFLVPISGFWEELGWRGLLQSKLQERFTPLLSAVWIGLIWGLWHLPFYARVYPEGARTPLLFLWFVLGSIPLSIMFAWLYNRTKESLLPVIVFHAAIDSSVGYFFARLPTGELRPFITWVVLLGCLAALLIRFQGAELGREHPVSPVSDFPKKEEV